MKTQNKLKLVEQLTAPFAPYLIKFKPTLLKNNKGDWLKENGVPLAGCMSYIDARLVRERLDQVFPLSWNSEYEKVDIEYEKTEWVDRVKQPPKKYRVEGLLCKLTIQFEDGTSLTRQDVGMPSNSDPLKGAYSDAFKRASVKFGIGEQLYSMGTYMIPYAFKEFTNITVPHRVKVEALGLDFYGDSWDDSERERICQTVSGNRKGCYHIEELTGLEGSKLVSGLEKKIATRDSEEN